MIRIGKKSASRKVYVTSEFPEYVIKKGFTPSMQEIKIQNIMSKKGLAPRIIYHSPTILIEDRMEKTLTDLGKLSKEQKRNLLKTIRTMWKNKIIHGDLKPDNIMYKNNKFYITDFETSKIVKNVNLYEMLKHQYFLNNIHPTYSSKNSKHFGKKYGWPTDMEYYKTFI